MPFEPDEVVVLLAAHAWQARFASLAYHLHTVTSRRGLATTPLTRPGRSPTATLAKLFRGLGDPTRLQILMLLRQREWTVAELVQELDSFQGRVSSHLACLRWCGLVESRREGRYSLYRVSDPKVLDILDTASMFLTENVEGIELCQIID